MSGPPAKKHANKNAWRRAKKKEKRAETPSDAGDSARESESPAPKGDANNDVQTVTSADLVTMGDLTTHYNFDDPDFEEYKSVFAKFQEPTEEEAAKKADNKPEIYYEGDDIPDEEENEKPKMTKKQKKAMNTLTIAQLKAMVEKPEMVEWTDPSAADPVLLLALRSGKNVVPVPSHWNLKREYLSSKRGIEKLPFALPKFIQETGISEMRDAVLEKQAEMTMRQKQRERVQGKLGKLDIDYAKLYDAFFRRQTKPEMTKYGEVYYEGKEYETNLVNLKPGELSEELRDALSMFPAQPPPWLINMQRFGPPPTYPNLRIPGVNAPIPPGAAWGYAAGQWGKAPVDEKGIPLFGGDLYGMNNLEPQIQPTHAGEYVEHSTWGVLPPEGASEDEESDEEEEDSDEEEEQDTAGVQTSQASASAPVEIGGVESIGGEFTLRKQLKGIETEEPATSGPPRSAYTVLPEKKIASTGFFGGEHAYDLKASRLDDFGHSRKRKVGDVDISVDVDKLGDDDKLDKDALKKEYEAKRKAEAQGQWVPNLDLDDLDGMIASESRKRPKRESEGRSRR